MSPDISDPTRQCTASQTKISVRVDRNKSDSSVCPRVCPSNQNSGRNTRVKVKIIDLLDLTWCDILYVHRCWFGIWPTVIYHRCWFGICWFGKPWHIICALGIWPPNIIIDVSDTSDYCGRILVVVCIRSWHIIVVSEVNLTRPHLINTPEATSDTPTQVHRGSARRLASPYALQCNTYESTNRARTHSTILREASAEHTGVLYTQPIRNNYIGRSTRIAGRHFFREFGKV